VERRLATNAYSAYSRRKKNGDGDVLLTLLSVTDEKCLGLVVTEFYLLMF